MNLHEIYLAAQLASQKSVGNADLSDYYTKSQTDSLISGKVDKVSGKGLSTNDFTNESKSKLDDLENYNDTEIKAKIDAITNQIFGLGNRISANSDLNSYTTAGVYYALNASDSATVSNNPSKTAGFRLEVSKVSTESGFKQTLYPNTTVPTLYIRYYSSAGFSSWYKFLGTEVTTT